MRPGARIAIGVALGLAVVFGAAPPALADAGPLSVSNAAFDQTSYQPDAAVVFTVDVTNGGTDDAKVKIDVVPTGFSIDSIDPPTTLAGSGTKTFMVKGHVSPDGDAAGSVVINGTATFDGATGDAPSFHGSATVVVPLNPVSGKIVDFADSTHGVAGATITLTNQVNSKKFTGTSDDSGAFTITDVPTGLYKPTVDLPSGWALHDALPDSVSVPGNPLIITLDQVAAPVNTSTSSAGGGGTTSHTTTTTTTHAAATLANTGAPIRWIAGGGGAVVLAGAILLLLARRRRETAEVSETPSA